jgi:hypothetical protein
MLKERDLRKSFIMKIFALPHFLSLLMVMLTCTMGNAQNVGIGTPTPVAKLNIVGNYSTPTIPGVTSTGVFRIGVSAGEGIDFGKKSTTPFSAWMQTGYLGSAEPLSIQPMGGNVGIGIIDPALSAKLDVSSTTQGFLPPRMTKSQRTAIASPVEGLMVYQTDATAGFYIYQGVGAGWTSVSSAKHFIGESFAGGKVFFITIDSLHGLIAETIDQSNASDWYFAQDYISYIANHSAEGQKFTDWRLPTRNELLLLFLQKDVVGGFASAPYWSSTEYGTFVDNFSAWFNDFTNGTGTIHNKAFTYHVRAVRAF